MEIPKEVFLGQEKKVPTSSFLNSSLQLKNNKFLMSCVLSNLMNDGLVLFCWFILPVLRVRDEIDKRDKCDYEAEDESAESEAKQAELGAGR